MDVEHQDRGRRLREGVAEFTSDLEFHGVPICWRARGGGFCGIVARSDGAVRDCFWGGSCALAEDWNADKNWDGRSVEGG